MKKEDSVGIEETIRIDEFKNTDKTIVVIQDCEKDILELFLINEDIDVKNIENMLKKCTWGEDYIGKLKSFLDKKIIECKSYTIITK